MNAHPAWSDEDFTAPASPAPKPYSDPWSATRDGLIAALTPAPSSYKETSMEHEFSEVGVDIGGVLLGSFSGSASLEPAGYPLRDHGFYVSEMTLQSDTFERTEAGFVRRIQGLNLRHPAQWDRGFNAELFRKIAAQIEADDAAQEAFLQDQTEVA